MLNTLTTTVVGALALAPSGAQQSAQEVFETAPNDTPGGKQQNRRVELVRLEART